MLNMLASYMAAFPKPTLPTKAPDSGDVVDKGNDLSHWFATRGQAFWTIVIVAIVAMVIAGAVKKPFVKGILLALLICGIVFSVMKY